MSQGGGEKKGRGWASGGRWRGGGALARAAHTMGEEDPGAGPVPITGSAQGPSALGASANSPGVTRWLPLKGRTWRWGGGGSGADSGSIFSRWTFAGEGSWVGSLLRGAVGTGGDGVRELRRGRRQVTAQVAERECRGDGPVSRALGRSSEPRLNQPGRGCSVVRQC